MLAYVTLPTCLTVVEFMQAYGFTAMVLIVGASGDMIEADGTLVVRWQVHEGPDGQLYIEASN